VLSWSRIVLVGVYLYLLFGPNDRVIADYALALGGITDFADGYIARRFDQVTTFGTALDPTADRLLLASAITSMIVYGAIPDWLAVVVLVREFSVASAVIYLGRQGAPRLEVTRIGKAAAFGFMVGFPMLLLGHGPGPWTHPLTLATEIALVPALALSYGSAFSYLRPAQAVFLAKRHASSSH
jgi:cardiolipin synthase